MAHLKILPEPTAYGVQFLQIEKTGKMILQFL